MQLSNLPCAALLPVVASPPLQPDLVHSRPTELPPAPSSPFLMPRSVLSPTILVFDSGLGGLTVFREVARARPDARFVYAADDALFPYGKLEEATLIARVLTVLGTLLDRYNPDLVVVACNTASTLVLPALRERFAIPFVGTVPAIKPACAASATKSIAVLGTEATVRREYTRALIRQYGSGCEVALVGSARLAGLAEAELTGNPASDVEISTELAPCFVEVKGRRTDTVVLACTHYPLLTARFEQLAPWPVRWIDPAPAIARRVVDLVGSASGGQRVGGARAVFTSGTVPGAALASSLSQFGLFAEAAPAI